MDISLYQKTTTKRPVFVPALAAANVLFALVCLVAWPHVAVWLEPIVSWVSGQSIGLHPRPMSLPFLLVWLVPAGAGIVGWTLTECGALALARPITLFPLLYAAAAVFLAVVDGWN
jgi:hypothetical protein